MIRPEVLALITTTLGSAFFIKNHSPLSSPLLPNILPYTESKSDYLSTPENAINLLPNDIIAKKIATAPIQTIDGEFIDAGKPVFGIFRANGSFTYISSSNSQKIIDNAVVPPWVSPVRNMRLFIQDEKSIRGGPIYSLDSTFATLRYAEKTKIYTGPVAIDALGEYVVAIYEEGDSSGLDVAESNPHHGGKFFQAPRGWKILSAVFGINEHKDNLLLRVKNREGNLELYWLVNAIPHTFPKSVIDACDPSSRHPLNDCEMRYIRNEDGKQREPGMEIRLEPVINSTDTLEAHVIWKPLGIILPASSSSIFPSLNFPYLFPQPQ
ncbi:MAG: hypothetical protein V1858_04390 [Candidatus Gottesmanbacteria bacterium]